MTMEEDNPIIVIDLETTGLNPRTCGILEIGAAVLDVEETRKPRAFLRHVRWSHAQAWESGAEKVHGITREEALSHSRYEPLVALEEFLDWLEDVGGGRRVILAGMNPSFDRSFLHELATGAITARNYGDLMDRWHSLVSHRTIDMHTLAVHEARRRGLPIGHLHTDAIYELIGMDPEPRPHRAITGARMEAEAIDRLLTGRIRYL